MRALAARSDIVLENFKVGALARYGLDYASLKAINPRLIYCSITGFGQDGPRRDQAAYDFMIQAMGGLMSVTGERDDKPGGGPQKVGVPVLDIMTGMYAAIAVLAALARRNETGGGDYIDSNMYASRGDVLLLPGCRGPQSTDEGVTEEHRHASYVAEFTFAAPDPFDLEELLEPTVPDVAAAPLPMLSKPLTAGVHLITGGPGGYDALVVQLKDSVVILGGGGNEAGGLALVAEARRLAPGKPITHAVNMHGHFDHAMVLPAFASAGITILTDDPNRYFLQESLNIPRTLVGDAFAKSKRQAKVESVIEKRVLGDATRSIELHHLKQVPHADGMLAAWLPKERILFVSDIEPPVAGEPLTPSMVALQQNLDRLGLDFETFISNGPRSTPPLSRSEFMARLSQTARAGER